MHVMQICLGQADNAALPIDVGWPPARPAPDIEQDRGRQQEQGKEQAEGEYRHGGLSLLAPVSRSKAKRRPGPSVPNLKFAGPTML